MDEYHTNDLLKNDFKKLKKFTFDGMLTKAKVVDIYDGDTLTIVFYFNGSPIKKNFRLLGYDAPEMKPTKTTANRVLHIQAAHVVKDFLKSQILNQVVWVKFCQEDKYGRLMGTIFLVKDHKKFNGDEVEINKMIIDKGFGKQYGGGHKDGFSEDNLIKIIKSVNLE